MDNSTLPRPFRQPEGRVLRYPVPADFEAFYRASLRFWPGGRVRSQELMRRHVAWARDHQAQAIGFKPMKRAMLSVGHRSFASNGVVYLDARFADELPDLPDNFPPPGTLGDAVPEVIGRLDAIMIELVAIRTQVTTA